MNPILVISVVLGYFALLFVISICSSKDTSSQTFFIAKKQSPWFLVAFGMIGASLSGITFISVPGEVVNTQFTYFQIVIGYVVGILVIAFILLPLYYRLNVYSIYEYLESRFGFWSYKTGAAFFLFAQSTVAAFKLFLMAGVLQLALFDAYGVPFEATVFVTLILIWFYTYRSGIKTVVYTDVMQTTFLLLAVILSIYVIAGELNLTWSAFTTLLKNNPTAKMFEWDWESKRNFFKLIFTGAFLSIVTNGLDQSVMQKHLTCRNLKESRINMYSFCIMLLMANYLFLILGLLFVVYTSETGIAIPENTDDLYPLLALNHFNVFTGIFFLLGISAAAYSSADSAMTALTTSFCVDFLNFHKEEEKHSRKTRFIVHLGVSIFLFFLIVIFKAINKQSVINAFIQYSGYTYGPLLGLFAFGLFTRYRVRDVLVPFFCVLSPILSIIIYIYSQEWFWGYQFGFEIIIVNAAFTFLALFITSQKVMAVTDSIRGD